MPDPSDRTILESGGVPAKGPQEPSPRPKGSPAHSAGETYDIKSAASEDTATATKRAASAKSSSTSRTERPATTATISAPPQQQARRVLWLLLLLSLVICAVPMLVELQHPHAMEPSEIKALAVSTETWRQWNDQLHVGQPDLLVERMVPVLNGKPQLTTPPGGVWLHMIGFALMPGDNADPTPQQFIFQARLVSVMMALLTLACVYWSGHSFGGPVTAALATLACAANPIFVYHARLASPAMQITGWTLLSIASALWAIRPLRPSASIERLFIGWVFAGLAMGAAVITGGAGVLLTCTLPVFAMLLICPQRIGHLMGLIAASVIAILIALPWAVTVHLQNPDAWPMLAAYGLPPTWFSLLLEPMRLMQVMGIMLLAMLPWTLWLGGAIVQPLSTSSAGCRTRMFLGWTWFISVLAALVAAQRTQLSDLLLAIPASAVLVAQLFRQYHDLAAEARYPRSWRLLRWPYLLVVFALSVAVAAGMHVIPRIAAYLSLEQILQMNMHPLLWIGMGTALTALAALSFYWMLKEYPARAFYCWGIWMLALLTFAIVPLTRAPGAQHPGQPEAQMLGVLSRGTNVYWYGVLGPPDSLLLYSGTTMPVCSYEQFEDLIHQRDSARGRTSNEEMMILVANTSANFDQTQFERVASLDSYNRTLWRYAPKEVSEAASEHTEQPTSVIATPESVSPPSDGR